MAEGDTPGVEIITTDLTKALEKSDFQEAERIIKENTDSSYLNRGAYGDVPLNLVLSGSAGYCNLYLAQLLVKQGADMNPYFPWQMAKSTPLEYIVKHYLDTKVVCEEKLDNRNTFSSLTFIGLHQELNLPPKVLKDHCWELIKLFLAYGADPGVVTSPQEPPVFHTVVADEKPDIELVMKLHEAGGDFNRQDIHGVTPLMDHVANADSDASLPLVELALSLVPDLELNHKSCNNETLLWRAMLYGSPRVAIALLRRGASPFDKALVDSPGTYKMYVSTVFAPMVQNSTPYRKLNEENPLNPSFSVAHFNKVMLTCVSPIVDCTDICGGVVDELDDLLSQTNFTLNKLISQEIDRQYAALLMLGNLKGGLQQMCVRKILDHLIGLRVDVLRNKVTTEDSHDSEDSDIDVVRYRVSSEESDFIAKLVPSRVKSLIKEHLKLPSSIVPRFLVEAARLQLGELLFSAESPDCITGCDRDLRSDVSNSTNDDEFDYEYDSCDAYDGNCFVWDC